MVIFVAKMSHSGPFFFVRRVDLTRSRLAANGGASITLLLIQSLHVPIL